MAMTIATLMTMTALMVHDDASGVDGGGIGDMTLTYL